MIREENTMSALSVSRSLLAGTILTGFAWMALVGQVAAEAGAAPPDFSSSQAGWIGFGDIVAAPGSPPIVSQDPAHVYVPTMSAGSRPTGWATFPIRTSSLESHALPIPSGLTAVEAAAIPETFFTVWHNTFERGALKAGETLLVHGGSSGIGTAAIQLAKAFGARVVTTAGSAEKCDACRRLGAEVAINYKTEDFVVATKAATGGKGAEVVLDMVGGDYIERNYEAAAVEGRIVQIAFQGTPRATVDFRRIMLKRLHHTGSTLRSRAIPDKGGIARAVERNVWPLVASGKVRVVIDSTFAFRDAALAHARMESSAHIGKIVLVW
jgi:NADPH2:quinone reductase